jgi:tRNA A37 N6-isopentenylltransferase MiaA
MNDIEDRLNAYLEHLLAVCGRWSAWIAEQEQAAVVGNYQRLDELTHASGDLLEEIQSLHTQRASILALAESKQLPSTAIIDLAQSLPSWTNPAVRERVRQAKRQMEHLRRLHLAIWVLISQCERFVSETMSLLNYGRLSTAVYVPDNSDTGGGRLLDAQL